jgi:hypothetical protein
MLEVGKEPVYGEARDQVLEDAESLIEEAMGAAAGRARTAMPKPAFLGAHQKPDVCLAEPKCHLEPSDDENDGAPISLWLAKSFTADRCGALYWPG